MSWLEGVFIASPWPMIGTWVVVYCLDYFQTIRGARLYREVGSQHITFEGSYELNPVFQRDIDRLRMVSPRFIALLVGTSILFGLYWWLCSTILFMEPYLVLCGAFLLLEAVVNIQHVRNIATFKYMRDNPQQIGGRVTYTRQFLYWNRALDFGMFALLFGVIFAFTASWVVAGGALAALILAGRMLWMRRRIARKAAQPTESTQPPAA